MKEITDIETFVEARSQPFSGYEIALMEINMGQKWGCWIWYIFPQLRGLGMSQADNYFGLADMGEAQKFLEHQVLGARLREIAAELLKHQYKPIGKIMGQTDAVKLKSSMTLFDVLAPGSIFAQVLEKFYGGQRCEITLKMLNQL